MRLTTRGKLAVTAITDLALHSHGHPVPLPAICARQKASLSYLEDIFSTLRRAGLVASTRGPGGGYVLTRAPEQVTVAEIVAAAEAPLARPPSTGRSDMTAELWATFQTRAMDYLQSITVAQLVAQHHQRPVAQAPAPAVHRAPQARVEPPATQLPGRGVPNSVFALGL
ncbi:Rrf2 family transcriptional regulator [Melaminivora sp.]|uniref:Rrf2 family transcriptional regulator n=1 Tax=Melaminivora sp. TaxID=1933032 RepID=UPI0028AE11A2|nr:Rrf2 family transcriptional regulator [Melaminivora sp.]